MPLLTYRCVCGITKEFIRKFNDPAPKCNHQGPNGGIMLPEQEMELVLSTPSAPHWNCRTAHSRSKGF